MIYDIIGDVHGQADKLENLFDLLGYTMQNGLYYQADHTPIFVGDLIDRGPQQKRVLDIVRPMVTEGIAQTVMGNHEYNAICYHIRKSNSSNGEWLRPHTEANTTQHQVFLKDFPLDTEHTVNTIEWFTTLPLYLDLGNFRVIHACWDQQTIIKARQIGCINENNRLNHEQLELSATKGTEQFFIIERLLKGPELSGVEPFLDKDGIVRHEVRTRWWGDISVDSTYRDLAFWYDSDKVSIPDILVDNHRRLPRYTDNLPAVFFGHYWLNTGVIQVQQSNVACLDYSAGKAGPSWRTDLIQLKR
ncbi:metallophosphoesterase [Desulfogranum japonicum]|uniref:metallophosphoesterase n=1 Tax=Desulfogranum japonicum TaxID=231447 RepID=UPI00068850D8|nr:metallophosphoesterase [Desulfogranum japonicum]